MGTSARGGIDRRHEGRLSKMNFLNERELSMRLELGSASLVLRTAVGRVAPWTDQQGDVVMLVFVGHAKVEADLV